MASPISYTPTPTGLKFHLDPNRVRLLIGPVGCGKSVAACFELFRLMASQDPSPDGFRRTRMIITRESYPMITTTTLRTWKQLFPCPETGRIVHGSPIVHYFEFGDIKAEVVFMSIENDDDIKKLMSLESTFIWMNEARFSMLDILHHAVGRTGRYPSKEFDGVKATRSGVILDTNPPDNDHWLYDQFEIKKPNNYSVHHYPPALIGHKDDVNGLTWTINPDAENIANLGEGADYYLKQVNGPSEEWIRVYLCGEWGSTIDGRPVYPEYSDSVHFAPMLKPVANIPIILGWDFGLTPCCVISQLLPNGQLIILEEIVTSYMGITSFIVNCVNPILSSRYGDFEIEVSVGDPAGSADMGGKLNERQTCFTILKDHGINTIPAKTNAFLPRRESVARRLTTMIDGDPSIKIGPLAPMIRKGLKGAYHYEKVNIAVGKGETKYKEMPDKDQYSHSQDALQYITLQFDSFKAPNSSRTNEHLMNQLGYNTPPRRY
jgi:hypothetical protein